MKRLAVVAMFFSALFAWASGARAQATGSGGVSIQSITVLPDQRQRCSVTVSGADGGAIARGSVVLAVPLPLRAGKLGTARWKISGDQISGIIVSGKGTRLASFEGHVNVDVIEGTFTTPRGATGSWRWEGGG